MNAMIVCSMKTNLVEGILDALLTNHAQSVQFSFLDQFLDLRLRFWTVLCLQIISLVGGTMAVPADLLHFTGARSVVATQKITFLGVTFHQGNKEHKLDVLVHFSFEHKIPFETGGLQIHEALWRNLKHAVKILCLWCVILILRCFLF